MAIKNKPSWDLSAAEIQKRADALPVLDRAYFARQTRADSRSSPTTRADDEILAALARAMTADQAKAFAQAVARGENPNIADFVSRADSTVTNGLRMIEQRDDSGRPIRTFVLERGATKMSAWMNRYAAVPQEMLALNVRNEPQDVFEGKRGKHLANKALREQAARDLAAGREVLCDLSIPMDRS